MKRMFQTWIGFGIMMVCIAVVSAASNATFIITPDTPGVFDGKSIDGIKEDGAPGYKYGSFQAKGLGAGTKTDMYFAPEAYAGRAINVGEIAGISYWTNKATTHADSIYDWYGIIYTKPFAGDASSATWYGSRIGFEPYYADNIVDPVNTWNQWSTDDVTNKLRFYESTAGAPGANFGSYADPFFPDFIEQLSLGTAVKYADQEVLFISIQTASNFPAGFNGKVDGLRVELTDGTVLNFNFEPHLTPQDKDGCKKDGWKTLFFPNGNPFATQGDCVSFVVNNK